jgi:hypothetical protein
MCMCIRGTSSRVCKTSGMEVGVGMGVEGVGVKGMGVEGMGVGMSVSIMDKGSRGGRGHVSLLLTRR